MKHSRTVFTIVLILSIISLSIGCTTKEDCDTEWAECMDNLPDNPTYVQMQRCYTQYDKCLDKVSGLSLISPVEIPPDTTK